jgi:hypothetical protein
MSYSRRQLYAMGEPLGDGATRRAVGGKVIYGSGGGGGNAEKQTTIVDLPEWAKPYAKESLGKAQALTSSPYQTYGGERTAQFSPLQKQAFDSAAQQDVAGQIGFGTGLAGLAGTSSFGDQGTAASFMSPYMDAVVQRQMESAQRQADIAGTQRGAQAVRAGAFGGSRQAVENAEAARALASQKGEIQASGLQSAFERAQQQFNQEQATRLNAAQTMGQLGQQQFGQEMGITGQRAQFGADQRAATQEILSTQYQDFLNQQRAPYDQLSFMSSIIRGTPMGQTTTAYQPPASPTSQLLGLGIAGAGAYGAYQGAQGRAAGGEVKGYAAGGIASLNQPEMAAMAGRMSDQQLGQTAQMPSITDLAKMTLDAEAKQRDLTRQLTDGQHAMMTQQPQGTVADGVRAHIAAMDQGLGGLEVPDDLVGNEYTAAGGGIVAFQNRGVVPDPEEAVSPFGAMLAPFRGIAGVNPRLAELRDRKAAAEQGFFEALTPTQKKARETEIQAIDAEIASIGMFDRGAAGTSTPIPTARTVDNRALLNAADAGIRSLPALTDEEKAAQAAVTTKPPAPSAAPGAAPGAAPRNTGPGAAPSMPSGGLAGLLKDIKTRETQLRDEAKQASDIEVAGLAQERTALEAAKEEAKKYGTEQEEKYKKRGERLEKDEKQNPYMSLIEAGLAMAAGESPNALKNIAVGAQQGLKGYQGRLEKVNEGRDGLEDAMFKLYNIRNDKVTAAGDKLRELGRAETEAKAKAVRSLSEISKGMFGEEIKVKTKEIDRAFDVWKTKYEQGQANIRAQAGRSPDQLALLTKYPAGTEKGDELRKNITFMKQAGRDDPILKDENYKLKARGLAQAEMLLNAITDPEKKAKQQVIVNNMRTDLAAMRGGSGSVGGGGSGTVDTNNPLLGP